MNSTPNAPPWPPVEGFDLPQAWSRLEAAVRGLEHALVNGKLATMLEDTQVQHAIGPALHAVYGAFGPADARALRSVAVRERRAREVTALLQQASQELSVSPVRFPATLLHWRTGGDHAPDASIQVSEPPAVLRVDQAISARAWGIAFTLQDQSLQLSFEGHVFRRVIQDLATDLRHMTQIAPRIAGNPAYPPMVPADRRFERLMLDILNEHRPAARFVSLDVDYHEKTDLRYESERGLGRKNGARVQVTALTDIRLHDNKLAAIPHAERLVVLSPISLARWLEAELAHRGPFVSPLPAALWPGFWQAIGQVAGLDELIERLRWLFQRALFQAQASPRGPLDAVPAVLRDVVRHWVEQGAIRSTRLLRAFETRHGTVHRGINGKLIHPKTPPPRLDVAAWTSFCSKHRPGSVVEVVPQRRTDHGLWARGPDDVEVFVMGAPAETAETLAVTLCDFSDDRRWVTAVPQGIDPAGVLQPLDAKWIRQPAAASAARNSRSRGNRNDPEAWRSDAVARLRPGLVLPGTVENRKEYGLFVQLLPGVVGLLHRKLLDSDPWPEDGATIAVRIESIDVAACRIALAPAGPADAAADAPAP